MSEKTLLLLGGSRYLIPVIQAAHKLGYRVVTCDYIPENVAHGYSDEYRNVSIVDKDAVLAVARELKISGIMSFAADPGVETAAFVAETLQLPFPASYEATKVLQNKNLFRTFLAKHGFPTPWHFKLTSLAELPSLTNKIQFPAIVKPTDSAGSKGVKKVDSIEQMADAVEYALSFSIEGSCLVEEYLEQLGDSSDADAFTIDGKFECISFTGQKFDADSASPYVPSSFVLPSPMPRDVQDRLSADLQRVSDLLKLRTGVYNIETRMAKNGVPYIMELTPRGGGNRLSEFLCFASGVDLVRASVEAAMNLSPTGVRNPSYNGIWFQEVLRSSHSGKFQGIWYAPGFAEKFVKDQQIWISKGDHVSEFSSANYAFGSVFLQFENKEQYESYLSDRKKFMQIQISIDNQESTLV